MVKKYGLAIVDKKDPNLRLEELVGKKLEEISFDESNPSKVSKNKLDRDIRKLMDRRELYSAVHLKAEKTNANIAVIEEKNAYSIKVTLYSAPEINPYCPTQLFEGGFGMDHTSDRYSLTKSSGYIF